MQPRKLTKAFIEGLAYEDKPIVVRDTKIKGLMIAVHKHTKSYKVQRDLWVGKRGRRRKVKTVRHTLGNRHSPAWGTARGERGCHAARTSVGG